MVTAPEPHLHTYISSLLGASKAVSGTRSLLSGHEGLHQGDDGLGHSDGCGVVLDMTLEARQRSGIIQVPMSLAVVSWQVWANVLPAQVRVDCCASSRYSSVFKSLFRGRISSLPRLSPLELGDLR